MGNARNIAFWVVLFLLILALFNLFSGGGNTLQSREISYSEFVTRVEDGRVKQVTLDGEQVRFRGEDGKDYIAIRPEDAKVTDLLIDNNIPVKAESQEQSGLQTFILSLLPFLLLIGVWIYFMNRMQGGGKGGAMGFGKSKAKMLTEKHGRVTFDDVAGIDEAKEELEEIVEFLRNPQKFSRLGGKIPKGALCWLALRAPVRRCWRARLREKRACRSSPSPAPTLSRCSWVSAPAACATCSSRPRRTRPASSSSTRSTPSGATGVPAMAAATTSASRR